jgi:type IV pilus assembly protein PilM
MYGGGMYGPNMPGMPDAKSKLSTLTRTDFLIQFVWQPPTAEDRDKLKDPEEFKTRLADEIKKIRDAEKENSEVKVKASEKEIEKAIEKASRQQSQEIDSALEKAEQAATPTKKDAAPAGTAPAPPAASPGTPK